MSLRVGRRAFHDADGSRQASLVPRAWKVFAGLQRPDLFSIFIRLVFQMAVQDLRRFL
jgi:hypothetical protein